MLGSVLCQHTDDIHLQPKVILSRPSLAEWCGPANEMGALSKSALPVEPADRLLAISTESRIRNAGPSH